MGRKHVVRWVVGLSLWAALTCPVLAAADGSLVFSRPGMGIMLQGDEGQDRVLFNQGEHVAPKLSPGGDRVLYNSVEGGPMGVWVLDLPGRVEGVVPFAVSGQSGPFGLCVFCNLNV